MGACFDVRVLKKSDCPTKAEVRERFRQIQDADCFENGHSYSGTIGMASGLKFVDMSFDSIDEAEEWVDDHAEKWEEALCVSAKGFLGDGSPDKVDFWVIGAICSS